MALVEKTVIAMALQYIYCE